jgi:hypothetical protein
MMNANRRAAAERDRKTYREVTAQLGLLAGAKGLYDMVKLQSANWRKQVDALTAQAEEVRALSVEPAAAAAAARTGTGVSQ